MDILGKRIKLLRKENKLTQEALANALNCKYGLNIDRVMISKWETGFQAPVISTLKCISDFFNVSLDYLNGVGTEQSIDKILIEALNELSEEETIKVMAFIEGLKANR